MSHLFKNNKYKKFYKIFKILIIIVILIIFSKSFLNYQGNKFNYITFSLLFNYLIIFAFRKNSTFFETFFSIFLWLGFWFSFLPLLHLVNYLRKMEYILMQLEHLIIHQIPLIKL